MPPSLTREGWGVSLSAESDDILFQMRITNGRFDIYHFTTSLPLSGKGDRLRWMSSFGRKVTFAQKMGRPGGRPLQMKNSIDP